MALSDSNDLKRVTSLIATEFGIQGSVEYLPGEVDLNFLICDLSGRKFIFKLARSDEDLQSLHLQNDVLKHLKENNYSIQIPRVWKTRNGKEMFSIELTQGRLYQARLFTYVSGQLLAMTHPHSPLLLN